VCIKDRKFLGNRTPVRKGDKFWYEVDKIGDTLGNRQITFHLYDVKDGMYDFGLIEKHFKNHFEDIQDFRQKQIDEILDDSIKPSEPIKSMFERWGSIEGKRDIKIDKILK
jgi:hypothetical protein